MSNEDVNFIRNLITSDEATSHVKGYVNRHNCRIWEFAPPDGVCIKPHSSPKVSVWANVTCYGLMGPYLFEEVMVKADHYLKMLKEFLVPYVKRKLKSAIFQQDGAPPHYTLSR